MIQRVANLKSPGKELVQLLINTSLYYGKLKVLANNNGITIINML